MAEHREPIRLVLDDDFAESMRRASEVFLDLDEKRKDES